jgi:hypothetical protein
MTLSNFPPEALDELALRVLDIAAAVREMALSSRENQLTGFQLHGNKVHEWLGHLEEWVIESTGRLDVEVVKLKGARRGRALAPGPATSGRAKRARSVKK